MVSLLSARRQLNKTSVNMVIVIKRMIVLIAYNVDGLLLCWNLLNVQPGAAAD
jgi:hypothetical protein